VGDMSVTDPESGQVACCSDNEPDPNPVPVRANGSAAAGRLYTPAVGLKESLGRVAALAAVALTAPDASVVGSSGKLIIGDTRLDRRICNKNVPGAAAMIAWAGCPCVTRAASSPGCSG
jgi:hypothetical protein